MDLCMRQGWGYGVIWKVSVCISLRHHCIYHIFEFASKSGLPTSTGGIHGFYDWWVFRTVCFDMCQNTLVGECVTNLSAYGGLIHWVRMFSGWCWALNYSGRWRKTILVWFVINPFWTVQLRLVSVFQIILARSPLIFRKVSSGISGSGWDVSHSCWASSALYIGLACWWQVGGLLTKWRYTGVIVTV